MRAKPQWCIDNCKYAKVGLGFCPDAGIVARAKYAAIAEGPGAQETLDTRGPDGYGRPLIGPTGQFWEREVLWPLGLRREDFIIGNSLHCRPPRNEYPTGKLRKDAEEACRHWDDKINEFNPDIYIVTFHPAACLSYRSPQFLQFLIKAHQMAKKFAAEGRRPCLLLGQKAMNLKAPWLRGGVKKWNRHFWEVAL